MAYRAWHQRGLGLFLHPRTHVLIRSFSDIHKLLCLQCTGDSVVNKPDKVLASRSLLLQTGGDRETIEYKRIIMIISNSGKISKESNAG